jgi:DNA-directed RNA polymerase specialized sigma24 family protein
MLQDDGLPGDASVTKWLRHLEQGHDLAAQKLWNVFFERLVRLARLRMPASAHHGTDAEDVALSAFASFFRGMENQRFSNLGDRQSLWRLLVCITIRKVLHVQRDQGRLKRGGKRRVVELDHDAGVELVVIEQVVSREPSPELAAQVAEEHRRWMKALGSEELTRLAEWKLEGFTNEEIAAKCGRTVRTVERKLNLIRKILMDDMSLGDGVG